VDILIKKARKKDPDAFIQLMEQHMQSMYKVAMAYLKHEEDAADAIQDTILVCYEKIDTLQQNRYFKTWLTRILINKCNDILKKRKVFSDMEQIPETGVWEESYTNAEWNELLSSMEEKYRIVLYLYYVEGFKIREIGQILEMNESSIRTRLARGREKMAGIYAQETIGRSNA
jgi:RNA polymerase sigma-70 factor (ECF subfamily)